MGKGDIKTKRGKIANKSYGVRRPKKKCKKTGVKSVTPATTEKPAPAKKAPAKKAVKKDK